MFASVRLRQHEYKRHFGEPPIRDFERLRELAELGPACSNLKEGGAPKLNGNEMCRRIREEP